MSARGLSKEHHQLLHFLFQGKGRLTSSLAPCPVLGLHHLRGVLVMPAISSPRFRSVSVSRLLIKLAVFCLQGRWISSRIIIHKLARQPRRDNSGWSNLNIGGDDQSGDRETRSGTPGPWWQLGGVRWILDQQCHRHPTASSTPRTL